MRRWLRFIIAVLGCGARTRACRVPTHRDARFAMRIPFTKAHGAKNDFLLTRSGEAPAVGLPAIAQAICDRHTGVGADGWMLIEPASAADHDAAIRLFNSDGSE